MGRRSINTTKSGKYMNPTDQARKEARKKELKKNKRQRQMVRAAVLKNKDPAQILEEMEKIDEMEYNVLQPSPLNEKVLKDKRKKLKETFERVMRLYQTEEPEHWSELKRKEGEYEKKRLKKQQYFESVKHAQSVQIDEIPLPSSNPNTPNPSTIFPPTPVSLSLPPFAPGAPPGLLKKPTESVNKSTTVVSTATKRKSICLLGVPLGPPPNLSKMPDLNSDAEDDEVVCKEYHSSINKSKLSKAPSSLQQRMLAISGQNIDEFMKEMEHVHKSKENVLNSKAAAKHKANDTKNADITDEYDNGSSDDETRDNKLKSSIKKDTRVAPEGSSFPAPSLHIPLPSTIAATHINIPAPPVPPAVGIAQPMMFRHPIRSHEFGVRPGMPRMGMRMPPGPPPGLPPRLLHNKHLHQDIKDSTRGITTITAKPQIRNLSADVTRFIPSALRTKREESKRPNNTKSSMHEPISTMDTTKSTNKDDAYLQFMNEMQGLL